MKITTAVCTRELDAKFPAELGENKGGWKRTSKSGNAKDGITREFEHRKLPVTATVFELNGVIASVTYGKPGPVEVSAKAQEYLFHISGREEGFTQFCIVAEKYWNEESCLNDESFDGELDDELPGDSHEVAESMFACSMTKDKLRAALLARGFKENADFSAFIGTTDDEGDDD